MATPTNDEVKELAQLIAHMNRQQTEFIARRVNARLLAIRDGEMLEVKGKLRVGSRVKLKNIKPKYLSGYYATVTGTETDKVHVRLINPTQRILNRFSDQLRVSYGCLEIVDG